MKIIKKTVYYSNINKLNNFPWENINSINTIKVKVSIISQKHTILFFLNDEKIFFVCFSILHI